MKYFQKKPFTLFLFLVFFCLLTVNNSFAYVVWYVDGGIPASGDGTSWSQPKKTIQEAIDVANSNDEIWVKMGTYPLSAIIEVNKVVAIYGGFAGSETQKSQRNFEANETVVDGQDAVRCFYVTADATIDGLSIVNGTYDDYHSYPYYPGGGGMIIAYSSPKILNCLFYHNQSIIEGGAILSFVSSPQIANCIFSENVAWWAGGGISGGTPDITGCLFFRNWAWGGLGGGIFGWGNITNCTFLENFALDYGGGICNFGGPMRVSNCIFSKNHTHWGGSGIYTGGSSSIISNTLFYENDTRGDGGGIYSFGSPTIINCTFYGNTANDTPYGHGGGIYSENGAIITNSVIWGNSARIGPQIYDEESSSSTVTYSDIQGGYPGIGNIDADPLFVDPENGDFHLRWDSQWRSPCIDAGTENAPALPDTDFEGDPRIVGPHPDMGADEFVMHISIDIKPGSDPNSINLKSKGVVPVAVLFPEDFKASTVDPGTVKFADASPVRWTMKDVDGDGGTDMVFHFETQELNLDEKSTEATLIGLTYGGMPFHGTDTVKIVPKKKGK